MTLQRSFMFSFSGSSGLVGLVQMRLQDTKYWHWPSIEHQYGECTNVCTNTISIIECHSDDDLFNVLRPIVQCFNGNYQHSMLSSVKLLDTYIFTYNLNLNIYILHTFEYFFLRVTLLLLRLLTRSFHGPLVSLFIDCIQMSCCNSHIWSQFLCSQ